MNTDKIYAEQIASEYSPKEATKVKQLKKLDAQAKNPATIFALSFGIFFTLVFGTGMCLAMQVIATGLWSIIAGVGVGVVGIIGCFLTYPIYKTMRKKGKEKYGSDILKLAKEISEENDDE